MKLVLMIILAISFSGSIYAGGLAVYYKMVRKDEGMTKFFAFFSFVAAFNMFIIIVEFLPPYFH